MLHPSLPTGGTGNEREARVERTGNSIGAEGRRQHDEDDPRHGDRQHREERLADQEATGGADEPEALASEAQADGVPDGTTAPEQGVKPGTELRLEEADVDAEPDRPDR